MLNKFSNLGKTLSREEQKNVLGGQCVSQVCHFSLGLSNGGSLNFEEDGYACGSNGSSEANTSCVQMINANPTVTSCHYDCEYDGLGQ